MEFQDPTRGVDRVRQRVLSLDNMGRLLLHEGGPKLHNTLKKEITGGQF